MEDILQTIVAHKRREVALHIAHTSLETMRARAEAVDRPTVSVSYTHLTLPTSDLV